MKDRFGRWWFRWRRRLPRAVRDALDALRPVPDPDPVVWDAHRRTYLAEVRRYAEDANHAGVLSPGPGAVSSRPVDRRSKRKGAKPRTPSSPREVRPMTLAMKLMLVLALALGGSAGTATAARESLPGSPLYPVKVQLENWEMTQAQTPEETVQRALTQSQNRVEEAVRLAERDRTVPDDVAERFQQQLMLALHASGEVEEAARTRMRADIAEMVQAQLRQMAQVTAREQGQDNGEDQAVQAMIRSMEQTRAQLGRDDEHGGQGAGGQQGPGSPNDEQGQGPGPGGAGTGDDEDAQPGNSYGPGDGTGDGEPIQDGEGNGPGGEGANNGYGPGDGSGDGEPAQDGEGSGPGDCTGDCEPDRDGEGNGPGGNDSGGQGNGPGEGTTGDAPEQDEVVTLSTASDGGDGSYGPGDGIPDGENDDDGEAYGPGGATDDEDSGEYGPGDGVPDGAPEGEKGFGPGGDTP